MESNTKTIAKRAREEPRTQMHMTIKMIFQNFILSTSAQLSDMIVFIYRVEDLDRANKIRK